MTLQAPLAVPCGVKWTGRHSFGVKRLEWHVLHQTRAQLVVCMGRNDGASGNRRRNSIRNRRKADFSGPAADDGLWFDAEVDPDQNLTSSVTSTGSSRSAPAASQFQLQPSTSSGWERAGSLSERQGGRQGRRRQAKESDGSEDEDEEDVKGWWERPEERSLQAYAAPPLEPWQEERLQRAYAAGRRKTQIQDLSRELGVDRSVIIGWFKEFALKSNSEREVVLSALRSSERGEREREVGAAVRQREGGSSSRIQQNQKQQGHGAAAPPAATAVAGGGRQVEEATASSGFIPYYLRKQQQQQGQDKPRKLKGEVLRTLEAIYDRTPFPSADVVRGLYELHRLPRDVASEWFASRRAQDGISSSTQKRAGRVSLREKDRDLQGAFSGGGEDDDEYIHTPRTASPVSTSASPSSSSSSSSSGSSSSGGSNSLLTQLGAAGMQQQQPEDPTVVTLSRREMAALRSSLPSPTKHKGRQMAEKLGIKTGPGAAATQINNVQYVEEVPTTPTAGRVRASWRYRASMSSPGGGGGGGHGAVGGEVSSTAREVAVAGARRLRLRGRMAAAAATEGGGGGAGSTDGSDGAVDKDGDK